MFKNQLDPSIQGIISDDGAIITPQENTSNDVFMAFLEVELTQRQF